VRRFDGRHHVVKLGWELLGALLVAALASVYFIAVPRAVIVNWSTVHQTIDGFGAATGDDADTISPSLMDFFYGASGGGISLGLIRVKIYPDLAACVADNSSASQCVTAPEATLTVGALANVQAAAARSASVWAAAWTPPAGMKSSGSYTGGAMIGTANNYTRLASIMASYVTLLTGTYNIPIYAVSVQNEPDLSIKTYESATWTAHQIHDFVPYLRTALTSAGYEATKIMIPEQSSWRFTIGSATMRDASTAAQVGILAAHDYDPQVRMRPPELDNITTQRIWETEMSRGGDAYDGGIANALAVARRIHGAFNSARVNAWHYWRLSAVPNGYTDNEALTDGKGHVAQRAYVIGNWSKFVRPGWHEVDVTNSGRLLVTAFRSQAGTDSAIVVVNDHRFPVPRQSFVVGSVMEGVVTPWITSRSFSLAVQSAAPITNGKFSYSIPAESVVTFVGRSGSAGADRAKQGPE